MGSKVKMTVGIDPKAMPDRGLLFLGRAGYIGVEIAILKHF